MARVTVIESTVSYSGTTYVTTLTAPSDPVNGQKTWTCREGNLLLTVSPPPTTVFVQPTTVTVTLPATETPPSERPSVSPPPTALPVQAVDYPSLEERDALADQIQLFEDVSGGLQINGTSVVSKEQYLGFFNVPEAEIGGHYGQNVLAKFAMHDLDGDGVLSFDETQLHCGGDGCH
ncbi:hypothetical protein LTR10_021031 [Elasticomyces elasticus]|nr:hypothetical protein LTR10_021031 [Elasticomyces elasticus]KAK5027751.1 hypothetical protein LTS07_006626 [Exophiala sideris]